MFIQLLHHLKRRQRFRQAQSHELTGWLAEPRLFTSRGRGVIAGHDRRSVLSFSDQAILAILNRMKGVDVDSEIINANVDTAVQVAASGLCIIGAGLAGLLEEILNLGCTKLAEALSMDPHRNSST